MIDNYSVENFKIHKEDYPFELKGLTLLTGANNSGKSSLTQSLRLLSKINRASVDYNTLPFDEVRELSDFTRTLNKSVNRSESITYTFSLDVKNFEFCNIILEFDSINNYNNTFVDINDEAILKKIDIYFKSNQGVFNFEYLINLNDTLPITYDLFKIDLDNNKKDLVQKDIIIRGIFPQFIPSVLKDEYRDLTIISSYLGNINDTKIKYVPAFRDTNEQVLANILEKYRDKIIFDNKSKLSDAFNLWTNKILNSEFRVKVEGNRAKIMAIDNNIEFDLSQIGFGNIQILPILVFILMAQKGDLVIIENPEVHLHPRWKTNLVELFYFAVNNGVNILVETQSMEIINRVRLKIKNNNELKPKTSLYFFEKQGLKSIIQKIEIENTGSLEYWPDDFVDKITVEDSLGLL